MLVKASARLRYVSIPPRKMRLVAGMVKGMPVEKALNILNFTPKIAARHIARTLKSAAANALSLEGTDRLKPEDLFIKKIMVDAAPTAKRIRFQSMGRAFRYRKRFCHLTVELEGEAETAPVEKEKKEKTAGISTRFKRRTKKGEAKDKKEKVAAEPEPEEIKATDETEAAEEIEALETTEATEEVEEAEEAEDKEEKNN